MDDDSSGEDVSTFSWTGGVDDDADGEERQFLAVSS